MITSFFPGRVRLRSPVFKETDLVEKAESILRTFPALKNLQHNPVTGSVLIEYAPEKVPVQKLLSMKDFFLRLANEAEHFDGSNKEKIQEMLDELAEILAEQ